MRMAAGAPPVPRLDAYSLRLFVTAAEEGSIARAAEREHIAASALSRRLADLEHALGVPLFVRSPRGIALTDAGRCVYERGLRIERDVLSLVHDVRALAGQVVGTVRLCANASAIVGQLPERLQAFRQSHPGVEIALQELRSWEVIRACLDDRADIGIAVATETPKGLDAWHFASDPLIALLPAGHALAGVSAVGFRELTASGLVGIQAGGALDQLLHERAEAERIPLRFGVTVNSFDAACRMVQAGLGAAIVPTSAVTAYAGSDAFARRTLAEPWAARELHVVSLRKSPQLRAVDLLLGALRG